MGGRGAALLLALGSPAAVFAQEGAVTDAEQMTALEAAIPKQDWYPDGYYDLRLAAEAEIAERAQTVGTAAADPAKINLRTCTPPDLGIDGIDPALRGQAGIAIETARVRAALVGAQFPAFVYETPLAIFERDRLAGQTSKNAAYGELVSQLNFGFRPPTPALPFVTADDDCPPPPPPPPESAGPTPKPRKPGIPKAAAVVPPPPRPAGILFVTDPPADELLMINAFAFKVCTRKQPDPWDRFQCRWNEIETGVAKPMSGRFVYQVKWPDGTIRKGTREVAPGPGGSATVTFRKTGS
jgi:hypothetical protein